MGWKNVRELEKLLPTPSKERVGRMDEVEDVIFKFNKKYYVDALLQIITSQRKWHRNGNTK